MRSSIFARFIALFLLMAGVFVFGVGKAHAAYNLIMFSSVTINTGYSSECASIVSDAAGNIFAGGFTNSDFFIIKYDNNFNFISSTTYDGGVGYDMVNALAVDNSGNVFAAGYTDNGTNDLYIAKYNNQLSQVLASSQYDSGDYDSASGMALDNNGNVFVTAASNGNYLTIKYDSNLQVISSVTYSNGGSEAPCRLAVDNNGNVFVTGFRDDGGTQGIFTLKYDNNLSYQASASYNTAGDDSGDGIAVDASGNVFVTGRQGDDRYITIKYTNNLVVISSAIKTSPTGSDYTQAAEVKVDLNGNVYAALPFGSNTIPSYYQMVKYDNNLNELSSFGYRLERLGYATAINLDPWGNTYLGGYMQCESSTDYDFLIMKLLAPATVSSVTPSSGFTAGGTNITIKGTGFVSGATVSIGGASATDVAVISSTTINAKTPSSLTNGAKDLVITNADTNSVTLAGGFTYEYPAPTLTSITPSSGTLSGGTTVFLAGTEFLSGVSVSIGGTAATNVVWVSSVSIGAVTPVSASLGAKNVTIVNRDSKTVTLSGGFTYFEDVVESTGTTDTTDTTNTVLNSSNTIIDSAFGGSVTIKPDSGDIGITIPAGTFGANIVLTVSTAAVPVSTLPTIKVANICITITNSLGLQPDKLITLTVNYRHADIVGLDETKLALCRYDPVNDRWIKLPSSVDTVNNVITATTNHLSTFVLVQLAPALDVSSIKAYPMPYNPSQGSLTIDNLPASAQIKIFTIAGELVCTVEYATANGKASWNGKNDNGSIVASGVYVMYIESAEGKKRIKIAVEK